MTAFPVSCSSLKSTSGGGGPSSLTMRGSRWSMLSQPSSRNAIFVQLAAQRLGLRRVNDGFQTRLSDGGNWGRVLLLAVWCDESVRYVVRRSANSRKAESRTAL